MYADTSPIEIPVELLDCLKTEAFTCETFLTYSGGQQKEFIDWIYSAKTEREKIERIAEMLKKLVKKEKFSDSKTV